MSPVRLLVLGLLLYIIYRLLTATTKEPGIYGGNDSRRDAVDLPVQDVLVEDPFCHKYIPRGQAVQLYHEKQLHYFCSNECSQAFLKEKEG